MGERKWRALDHCENKRFSGRDVWQEADQIAATEQKSFEKIIVKDSEGVRVQTTDTQIAATIQVALQIAIAVVVRITIGDNVQGNSVVEELKQFASIKQKNSQKTIIENSTNVNVTATDTDIAVNLQVLLQVLIAILVTLDIL
ncbi:MULTISPECIES: spore coat protein [Bacillaceae]|jgi:spore coat protein X|uniref:Spore coat protein n=3 Tax=Priestia TaxID=2800373 RepID=A0AAX6NIP7_PRIAR|nr:MULTISPECIES: spore coat protein [Bacillaceae]MBK0295732.1 spore coat protein [Bacillus sp. S34]UPK52942.1 spore coat protein [Bacillus sp. H8-1]AEN92106.1 Spore coat protein X (Insoluble fraction) [Priestia megaterium WSH-002]AKP80299.1 Spore coat protein X [Priestia megaterium Q3]AWD68760.1 spore coat protein [Priestia megaterium]